ncbi:MAG: hypothetical protein M1829_002583 [Trizodia sp. TS-e1964]|nr:MAG: hypothetical protein M1829_002583 [Trizodia sp. TS-e1964]
MAASRYTFKSQNRGSITASETSTENQSHRSRSSSENSIQPPRTSTHRSWDFLAISGPSMITFDSSLQDNRGQPENVSSALDSQGRPVQSYSALEPVNSHSEYGDAPYGMPLGFYELVFDEQNLQSGPYWRLKDDFGADINYPRTIVINPRQQDQDMLSCLVGGCDSAGRFRRKADLIRHYKTVHFHPDLIPCPRRRCSRKGDSGFKRQDHLMEHLRNFHGDGKVAREQ